MVNVSIGNDSLLSNMLKSRLNLRNPPVILPLVISQKNLI